jgi:hypothetical protein
MVIKCGGAECGVEGGERGGAECGVENCHDAWGGTDCGVYGGTERREGGQNVGVVRRGGGGQNLMKVE